MEQRFNSIEEAKDFLLNTTEDKTILGSISFVEEETGQTLNLSFQQLIEKVGIDKAAEFLFEAQSKLIKVNMNREEIFDIIRRMKQDPNSLSDKEKIQVTAILSQFKNNPMFRVKDEMFDVITKILIDNKSILTEEYSGVLSLLLTYLEALLISSSSLSQYVGNPTAMHEIAREASTKITIDDDIDDETLMLAFIHVIGNRFIKKQSGLRFNIDYDKFIDVLGVDRAYVYECPGCKEERKDCSNCSKRVTESEEKEIENIFEDALLKHAMEDIKESAAAETSEKKETKSESSGVIDIRDRLKKRD